MIEYEYLIGTMTDKGHCVVDDTTTTLCELGEGGWDLVSVGAWMPYSSEEAHGVVAIVVFKRENDL